MQGDQYMQLVAQQLKASQSARHSASKYDFVKVRYSLGRHTRVQAMLPPPLLTYASRCR